MSRNMSIIVAVDLSKRYNIGGVPEMDNVTNKIKEISSKQEFVLPIFIIFKSDFLLNWMIFISKLQYHFLFFDIINIKLIIFFLCWLLRDFHIIIFRFDYYVLINPLVDSKVSISPLLGFDLHHICPHEGVFSTKALIS
jgi:hypothetical protein